jgi:hypothetical protein
MLLAHDLAILFILGVFDFGFFDLGHFSTRRYGATS